MPCDSNGRGVAATYRKSILATCSLSSNGTGFIVVEVSGTNPRLRSAFSCDLCTINVDRRHRGEIWKEFRSLRRWMWTSKQWSSHYWAVRSRLPPFVCIFPPATLVIAHFCYLRFNKFGNKSIAVSSTDVIKPNTAVPRPLGYLYWSVGWAIYAGASHRGDNGGPHFTAIERVSTKCAWLR